MFPWKCEVCGCRKLRFIKEKEASGLLSGLLGLKSSFKRIPILVNII